MKKTLALVLALVMVLSMAFAVWAEDAPAADEAVWELTTELKDGDKVLIGAPAYGKLLSAEKVDATSFYNKGVDYAADNFANVTDAEIFVVGKDGDNYTFTSLTGKSIALADSYSSLNEEGANKAWALEAKGETTFLVKNVARGNYLEWYNSKNNWSSYNKANDDQFEISFYVEKAVEEQPPVDEPVVEPEVPAAVETLLYAGGDYSNMCWSGNNSVSYGHVFTVAEGKAVSTISVFIGGSAGAPATFKVYQWDTDYATTVAGEPLHAQDITMSINAWVDFPVDNLDGTLMWEIASVDGSALKCAPMGGIDAITDSENGLITDIHHVWNGTVDAAFVNWSEAKSARGKVTVVDKPVIPDEVLLYGGEYAANQSVKKANPNYGQKFTVPAGKKMVNISIAFSATGGGVPATINVYKWVGDYATTVAGDAVATVDFVGTNMQWVTIDLGTELTGELFWEIYQPADKTLLPMGGTELIEGVENYASGAPYTCTGWDNANTMAVKIGVIADPNYVPETPHEHNFIDGKCECGEEDPNYVPPVVVEEEVIKLYNGDPVSNMANKTWEGKFGQIFTVPAGKEMTKITIGFQAVDDPDGNGKPDANAIIKIWAWDTDYATTVAAEPLVVIEQNVVSGDNEFVLDTALTGTLFWEAHAEEGERLAASGAKQKAEGVINVIDGVENAACTGWDGANTIRASITVVVDEDYVPHEHNFVDGKCECGEEDPNYEPPHEHNFVDGKCECGEEDPNYEPPHEHNFVDGKCECGEEDPNYEPPTTETTEVTTEVTTEENTEETTEDATVADTTAADTTAAGTTAAGTTAATTEEAKGGCGSVVGSAIAVAVIAMAGAAAVVLKKRD